MDKLSQVTPYVIDVNAPLVLRMPVTKLMEGDNGANTLRVQMMDGGEAANLSGYTAVGEVRREDGKRVTFECTISGNVITGTLNADCYAYPGECIATIQLAKTDGFRRTVLMIGGTVMDKGDGPIIDGGKVIKDVAGVIAMLDEMRAVTDETKAAAQTALSSAAQADAAREGIEGEIGSLKDTTSEIENEIYSDNLLNPADVRPDTVMPDTPSSIDDLNASTSYGMTGVIEVEPSTDYYFYGLAKGNRAWFFNENKSYTGRFGGVSAGEKLWRYTTASNTRYLRIRTSSTDHIGTKAESYWFGKVSDWTGETEKYGVRFITRQQADNMYAPLEPDNRKMYLPKRVYVEKGKALVMPYRSFYFAYDMNSVRFNSPNIDSFPNKVLFDRYRIANLSSSQDSNMHAIDSKTDKKLESSLFSIKVVDTAALSADVAKNLLIVGDSFVNSDDLVDRWRNKLNEYGLTNIHLIGTNATDAGNKHEGRGGHAYIDYISDPATLEGNHVNPFWNSAGGAVDFANYAAKCGVSTIDYMVVHLGVNDLLDATPTETIVQNMQTFVGHAKAAFPNIKIIIDGLVIPALDCPSSYNPTYQSGRVFRLNAALEEACETMENVHYAPVVATFDAEHAYPYKMEAPYDGSTEQVKVLTDYLHPYTPGYNMIADQSMLCLMFNALT